jgi:hypothetical protein
MYFSTSVFSKFHRKPVSIRTVISKKGGKEDNSSNIVDVFDCKVYPLKFVHSYGASNKGIAYEEYEPSS